jgi:GPI-anchor transamidase subunit U
VSARLFTSTRKYIRWDSKVVAAGYLFNPFTIATCLGRSTNLFTNCGILYAISNAVMGNSVNAMLALAFASYLSLYPLLLLPPLILLCFDRHIRAGKKYTSPVNFAITHFGIWAGSIVALLYMSYFITGNSWDFLPATYGFQLLVPDLTPNVGLWWYFFIEIFDSFREFFLGVFWLHLVGYVGGLTFRIRRQPLFVITSLLGLFAIFKPYPSISDVSLYLSLLLLYRHVFPREYLVGRRGVSVLTIISDAIHVFRCFNLTLCNVARPRILPLVDLCRIWKRKLLLCYYSGMELSIGDNGGGLVICCSER